MPLRSQKPLSNSSEENRKRENEDLIVRLRGRENFMLLPNNFLDRPKIKKDKHALAFVFSEKVEKPVEKMAHPHLKMVDENE